MTIHLQTLNQWGLSGLTIHLLVFNKWGLFKVIQFTYRNECGLFEIDKFIYSVLLSKVDFNNPIGEFTQLSRRRIQKTQ